MKRTVAGGFCICSICCCCLVIKLSYEETELHEILFSVKAEMVYAACGNQDYDEVVKRSEENVQELQVCVAVRHEVCCYLPRLEGDTVRILIQLGKGLFKIHKT